MDINKVKEFFISAKEKNRISAAYIIDGGTKKLREEGAMFLSYLLNCPSSLPCLECSVCKSISNKTYPDIKWVIPSKSALSIDDLREVKKDIYITPYMGEHKLYIFNIDYMREEAANSFLKIIEEPPIYSTIMILTKNINFFLPTIVSRCQRLRLNYMLPENIESFSESQKDFLLILNQLSQNKFYDFFQKIEFFVKQEDRKSIEEWVEKIIYLYRDKYLKQHKIEEGITLETEVEVANILMSANTVKIIEYLLEIKERIRYNINLKLGLENLFIQIDQLY